MRLFESTPVVAELSARCTPGDAEVDSLTQQVTLAWYLRQSDPGRAMAAVDAVRQQLAQDTVPHSILAARLDLVEAEAYCLAADYAQARQVLERVLNPPPLSHDAVILADACFLNAIIYAAVGDLPQRDAAMERAVDHARSAQDSERVDFFEGYQARYAALRNVRESEAHWGTRFEMTLDHVHPAVATSLRTYFAARAYHSGQFVQALDALDAAFESALQTGQMLTAVIASVNLSNTYLVLNDHEASLAWSHRGLVLARNASWPAALGPCLSQLGEVLRSAGRLDEAQVALEEAMQVYEPLRQSRNFTPVLSAMGDLALDRGDYPKALALFRRQRERVIELGQPDLVAETAIGVANVLYRMGEWDAAQVEGHLALDLACQQGATATQVSAHRVLAKIHAARGESALVLDCLQAVQETAAQISGYSLSGELLFEMADQYAQCGRTGEAYQIALQAHKAREKVLTLDASNRAAAIQARLETQRARTEAEYRQRHAESEASRATLLRQTSDTLELLGTIGQEITSQLDQDHVFKAIERHVHGLLDATAFAIYLMDADGQGLTSAYDIENGVRLPGDRVRLDDPIASSARCVRERQELLIAEDDSVLKANQIPGTLFTRSALFAPLIVGDRVLGVMTIQSPKPSAYAQKERLVFRTLCAYTAIALDNTVAYGYLRDAKEQLIAQEKLAALGALVAGVAHELNTPIGNSLLTVSALQQKTVALQRDMEGGTLRRSTLSEYAESALEGVDIISRGLQSAADLVQSFKQVAVDRATEQRRPFDLLQTTLDIVATLQRSISKAGHRLDIDIPAALVIDGYPGPYGQVITNLINNALLHAFDGQRGGAMHLSARAVPDAGIEIVFSDNGVGIAPQHLPRIFEPFFSTKMGQGGSGLGMSISYNIVTAMFGGELRVESATGAGARFVLALPLVAPQSNSDDAQLHRFRAAP